LILTLGAISLVAVLAVLALWRYELARAVPRFQFAKIDRGSIKASVSAAGTCNAVVNVQVGSEVSGNIKALYADFNSIVKSGQLVALINPEMTKLRPTSKQRKRNTMRKSNACGLAIIRRHDGKIGIRYLPSVTRDFLGGPIQSQSSFVPNFHSESNYDFHGYSRKYGAALRSWTWPLIFNFSSAAVAIGCPARRPQPRQQLGNGTGNA
jgi:hypothetical protein